MKLTVQRIIWKLFILATLALVGSSTSALAAAGWLNDPSTGCKVWSPELGTAVSVTWTGACENGYASGGGILHWLDENKKQTDEFIGYCVKGKMHGSGVLVMRKGNRYAGEFFEGQFDGKGTLFFRISGERYVGDFKNGAPHGRGVFFRDEGQIYVGEYVNFEQTGYGVLIYPDGTIQKGKYEKGTYLGPN